MVLILLLLVSVQGSLDFPANPNIENYLIAEDAIASPLTAFTHCSWVSPQQLSVTGSYQDFYWSYSVGNNDNVLIIGFQNAKPILFMSGNIIAGPLPFVSDDSWTFVCWTWEAVSRQGTLYLDGEEETSGDTVVNTHPSGGILVIGQEQDISGGLFDRDQNYRGGLNGMNFWDRALSAAEISGLFAAGSCGAAEAAAPLSPSISWDQILSFEVNGQVDLIDDGCVPDVPPQCWTTLDKIKGKKIGKVQGDADAGKSACEDNDECKGVSCSKGECILFGKIKKPKKSKKSVSFSKC